MKQALCKLEELSPGKAKKVDFFGRDVLVYEVDGRPQAVLDVCMHLGGPMELSGDRLVCAWHGAEFGCRRGERVAGPARPDARLIVLPTRVEDGTLYYEYGD